MLGRARYSLLLCDSMEMVPASLTCGAARGAGCQGREVGRHGRGREVGRRAVGWHEGVRWERWKRWERGERRTESGERRAESGERRADSGERGCRSGGRGERRGEGEDKRDGTTHLEGVVAVGVHAVVVDAAVGLPLQRQLQQAHLRRHRARAYPPTLGRRAARVTVRRRRAARAPSYMRGSDGGL